MGILVFITWFVLCIAVAKYADSKGRSEAGVFFLSFFLSPLVGFVVALAMRPDENKVAFAQGKKKCPQCAEFVQPEARICRFCQYQFERPNYGAGYVATYQQASNEAQPTEWKPTKPLTKADFCPSCGVAEFEFVERCLGGKQMWRCMKCDRHVTFS